MGAFSRITLGAFSVDEIIRGRKNRFCCREGGAGMELDHLFLCVGDRGRCGDLLTEFGLREGSGNRHEGQGTANRRFFFRNLMLEILWVEDEEEARSPLTAPMGLWERCGGEEGRSPFGIGLRVQDPEEVLPFPIWEFCPPYLGGRGCIRVGCGAGTEEPLVFCIPAGAGPYGERNASQPKTEVAGAGWVREVELRSKQGVPLSGPLEAVNGLAGFRAFRGDEDLLTLRLGPGPGTRRRCFAPALPLELRW